MAGHDWEALHRALGQATGEWSREELVVLLRDLIQEYVIERGLPTGTPGQAAAPDLTRLDFPGLIAWLKGNLSVPELALFSVDGRRVIVDADGPREIAFGRATEQGPPVPQRPAAAPRVAPERPPTQQRPGAATAPARPAAAPVTTEPEAGEKPKSLNRGFRGLEFD